MIKVDHRLWRMGAGLLLVWGLMAAAAAWLWEPGVKLVTARASGPSLPSGAQFSQANLSSEKALLIKTRLWPMERNGQVVAPPASAAAGAAPVSDQKPVVWNVAAVIARPTERYVVLIDEAKNVLQVGEGAKLPDGSTVLRIDQTTFTVRLPSGKKHTYETSN